MTLKFPHRFPLIWIIKMSTSLKISPTKCLLSARQGVIGVGMCNFWGSSNTYWFKSFPQKLSFIVFPVKYATLPYILKTKCHTDKKLSFSDFNISNLLIKIYPKVNWLVICNEIANIEQNKSKQVEKKHKSVPFNDWISTANIFVIIGFVWNHYSIFNFCNFPLSEKYNSIIQHGITNENHACNNVNCQIIETCSNSFFLNIST